MLKKQTIQITASLLLAISLVAGMLLWVNLTDIKLILSSSQFNKAALTNVINTVSVNLGILLCSSISLAAIWYLIMEKTRWAFFENSTSVKNPKTSSFAEVSQVSQKVEDLSIENKRLINKLVEQNRITNRFAYVVSHDLRSPIRTVHSFVGLLRRELGDRLTEREDTQMNFILEGTEKLRSMVDEILEYSRMEKTLIQCSVIDLKEILDNVLEEIKPEIEATKATIILPDALPKIFVDSRKVKVIFAQLLLNSLLFLEDQTPEITITCDELESEWEFNFKDNGIGIKPAEIENVFLPFVKLQQIAQPKGIGVGLALCRQYVELHLGKIQIIPTEMGTHVQFTLPKDLEKQMADLETAKTI